MYHKMHCVIDMTVDVEREIFDLLYSASEPLTPQEVAEKLGISWSTAQIHLFKLLAQNPQRISYARKGRQSLFWIEKIAIKIRFPKGEHLPDLAKLSNQLANEWLDESTAEQIIDKERRKDNDLAVRE